jgi:AraC-like DNA-binding protein
MDALADVIDVSRVRGALLAHVRAYGPWGIRLHATRGAAFHAVLAGACWLRVEDSAPRQLMPGDVVLLPTGIEHELVSELDGGSRPYDRVAKEQLLSAEGELVISGHGACARFLCASYDYDHNVVHPLLSLLPPVLHIPASTGSVSVSSVAAVLQLLAAELGDRQPAAPAVVNRLVEVVFVHVLRGWIQTTSDGPASWLRSLRDPVVARTLTLMRGRPDHPWTLDFLAREVAVSRATLARRFTELVGEPPLSYLMRWRMDLAARSLRESDQPIEAIAASVGYTSEFAFSRAFAGQRGAPPGRYRKAQRSETLLLSEQVPAFAPLAMAGR